VIAIIHDCVRAVLVLVVLAVGLEILQVHREPRPWQPAAVSYPPAWQPVPVAPERPIRRVASSVVDLAESVLGVLR
jgi:hypothetical protein